MTDERTRQLALDWIAKLTDKQFAEFFTEAVRGRLTSDTKEQRGHFVLADASFDPDDKCWDLAVVCVHDRNHYDGEWDDEAPICQAGECSTCKAETTSWARYSVCPVCGTLVYGT